MTTTRVKGKNKPQREEDYTANFPVQNKMKLPEIGSQVLVELPGERMMAEVAEVVPPDKIIVELTELPLGKAHRYAKDDFVPCRYEHNGLEYLWKAFQPIKGK